eukprot:Sdes_comp20567_c0_seq1m15439
MACLRAKQIAALKVMFDLNEGSKKNSMESTWKVLIYDRFGQDIISPLLKVGELRDAGITLHMLLHSDRDPIPDVPAIYFVMPTRENILRICRDCKEGFYDEFYLNFISSVPRNLLEELAAATLEANVYGSIKRVFDQYLNFISLEEDLFTVRVQEKDSVSYFALNNSEAKDSEIELSINEIVDSLFSALLTMGNIPIIRSPRGNAAEMVAEKLDSRIRDYLKNSRNNSFGEASTGMNVSFQRSLVVIVDRNMDISTSLHHTWTYQALVHDLLDLHLNRVSLKVSLDSQFPSASSSFSASDKKKLKTYELDPDDSFWASNRGLPFPTVATEVEAEMVSYKKKADELSSLGGLMGLDSEKSLSGADSENLVSENTKLLTSAVSSLPELTEKKLILDKHTTIATNLLDQIKERQLDTFFDLEERILNKQSPSSYEKSVLAMLEDPLAGTPQDKLRLYIMYFMMFDDLPASEMEQCERALESIQADISALKYLKRMKAFHKMSSLPQSIIGGSSGNSGVFSSVTKKMFEHGSEIFKQGVKNLLPG